MTQGASPTWSKYENLGEYDVVVAGAGPAGIGAACGAARMGMRTLIVEKCGYAGGVAGGVACPYLMGFAAQGRQIVAGVADELVRELDAMGHAAFMTSPSSTPERKPIGHRPLLHNVVTGVEAVRVAANRLLERDGVERLFYTSVTGAGCEGSTIVAALLDTLAGPALVRAKSFVDATGDAHLVARAGGAVRDHPIEDAMTKTILIRVGGVLGFHREQVEERFYRLVQEGAVPFEAQDRFMGFALLNPGEVLLNFTLTTGSGLSSRDMTRMDAELREQALITVEWFRQHIPHFVQCYLVDTSTRVGVRAGRGIVGLETITTQAVDEDLPVPEPIALGTRGYGGHGVSSFSSAWAKRHPGVRAIPWRALIARSFDNVAAGGRAISCDGRSIDTFRLMSRCIAIGQAAGVSAGLAASQGKGMAAIDYCRVRDALLKQGAILQ